MGPGMLAFNGIPGSPVPLDGYMTGPGAWLMLAFSIFLVGAFLWLMIAASRERLVQEVVRCPEQGRRARVFVRRKRDGRYVDIQACSALSPRTPVTCSRACRSQLAR